MFVFGDLNYRLRRTNAGEFLEDVAEICRVERDEVCGGEKEWRRKRYAALFGPREGVVAGEVKKEVEVNGEEDSESVVPLDTKQVEVEGGKDGEGENRSGETQRDAEEDMGDDDEDDEEEEEDEKDEDEDDEGGSYSSPRFHGVQGLVRQVESYLSEPSHIEMNRLTIDIFLRLENKNGGDATEDEEDDLMGVDRGKHRDLQRINTLNRRHSRGGRVSYSLQQQRSRSRRIALPKCSSSSNKDFEKDLETGGGYSGLPKCSPSWPSSQQGVLTPTVPQLSAGAPLGGSWGPPVPSSEGANRLLHHNRPWCHRKRQLGQSFCRMMN